MGCPHYTPLSEGTRRLVAETHQGEFRFLGQSMFNGPLYDDDRYVLLSPRRFEELTHLRTIEGTPIPAPEPQGIVPAGTPVRVDKIEFPTGDVVLGRPLYTPRYSTWVWLAVARDDGSFPEVAQHIVLLPEGIADRTTFARWFDGLLPPEDPGPWLEGLDPHVRAGIREKRALVGMDYPMLVAALGYPDRLTPDQLPTTATTLEVALYGDRTVVLENGRVTRISPGQAASATSAGPVPR